MNDLFAKAEIKPPSVDPAKRWIVKKQTARGWVIAGWAPTIEAARALSDRLIKEDGVLATQMRDQGRP